MPVKRESASAIAPSRSIATYGVLKRAWILPSAFGSSPSADIA